MTFLRKDEPGGMDLGLDEWGADTAPADFATRVTLAARGEITSSRSPNARRSVVVPLLLVALSLSAGAAAAWDRWKPSRTSLSSRVEDVEEPRVGRPSPLSFHLVQEQGSAVPEKSVSAPAKKSVLPVLVPAAENVIDEEATTTAPPPRVVHWPQCECGTSGVVCTCSD